MSPINPLPNFNIAAFIITKRALKFGFCTISKQTVQRDSQTFIKFLAWANILL